MQILYLCINEITNENVGTYLYSFSTRLQKKNSTRKSKGVAKGLRKNGGTIYNEKDYIGKIGFCEE